MMNKDPFTNREPSPWGLYSTGDTNSPRDIKMEGKLSESLEEAASLSDSRSQANNLLRSIYCSKYQKCKPVSRRSPGRPRER